MRELTTSEVNCVSGGTGACTPESSGNDFGGISDFDNFGKDVIAVYEGLVAATSHIIERVATSF